MMREYLGFSTCIHVNTVLGTTIATVCQKWLCKSETVQYMRQWCRLLLSQRGRRWVLWQSSTCSYSGFLFHFWIIQQRLQRNPLLCWVAIKDGKKKTFCMEICLPITPSSVWTQCERGASQIPLKEFIWLLSCSAFFCSVLAECVYLIGFSRH